MSIQPRVLKADPSQIEWRAAIIESDGEMEIDRQEIGVHLCLESDFDQFYEISAASKHKYETIKQLNGLYCLDKHDKKGRELDLMLYGPDEAAQHRRLDIVYAPC